MVRKTKKKLTVRRKAKKMPKSTVTRPGVIGVARVVTPGYDTIALLPKNPTLHFHRGEPLGKKRKYAGDCIEVKLSPDKKGLTIRTLEGGLLVKPEGSNSIEIRVERW